MHPLIEAMLLGNLKNIPEETVFLYARTGLIHLFSASGFHMAAAIGLSKIVQLIPISHRKTKDSLQLILSLFTMAFLGSVTSWSSPIVRAFTFTSLNSVAKLAGIKANKHWIFLLSLLCSSVLGKGTLLSFILSAAGMAGVIYLPSYWGIMFGPWIATLPICIFVFHMFSLSSILWNLSIGTLITYTCLPLAILSLLLKPFCSTYWLDYGAGMLASTFTSWLERGDQFLGMSYWVPQMPWLLMILGLYLFLKFKHPFRYAFLSCLGLIFFPLPKLAVLNIGQGDAIFLDTGEKNLIDVGPNPRKLNAELGKYGISSIDNLMITHPDKDHRGGLEGLLVQHRVKQFWLRKESIFHPGAHEMLIAAERANLPIYFLSALQWQNRLKCWFAPVREKNDLSPLCVAKLKDNSNALFTGDMSGIAENYFLSTISEFPKIDYLKIAHHGSRYSSSKLFLQATNPQKALISVGKNSYGQPSSETLRRIEEKNIPLYRTDKEGSINFYSLF